MFQQLSKRLVILATLLLLSSCSHVSVKKAKQNNNTLAMTEQGVGCQFLTQEKILQRINKIRQSGRFCYKQSYKGDKITKTWYEPASAVQWNEQLAIATKHFAEDMATHDYYNYFGTDAHLQPNTSKKDSNGRYQLKDAITLLDRVNASGYKHHIYENMGYQYDSLDHSVDTAFDRSIEAWLASKHGHCDTIMLATMKDFAMGCGYNAASGKYYFTQLFGAPNN